VIGVPDTTETVRPSISLGAMVGLPLNPLIEPHLLRTVVDTHLHLPDMFELTFADEEGTVAEDAGLVIGQTVSISAGAPGSTTGEDLITGEITSIEAICDEGMTHTVIRGYEKAHRLQRAKRSRTFVNMKDSDIARKVAGDAELTIGTIDETQTTHDHMAQVAQTDWEFLTQRAREVGFEVGVAGGEFFFRKASGSPAGGGLGGAVAAVASALGMGGELTFKDNLITFLPRISAANITPDVEVRVWDAKAARVAVGSAPAKTGTAKIDGQDPAALAKSFKGGLFPALPSLPAIPPIPGLPKIDFGTAPSNTAYVVVDRPMANGAAADTAASEAAIGLADHVSSTFAEAEGYAVGDPAITAGATVKIKGVPKQFVGDWVVTNAKHILDAEEGGYHVRFYVSGRQDRSLLKLADGGGRGKRGFGGLVCGIVTNAKDPDDKGRVKVALPWLAPNYESDWARVVQFGTGMLSGSLFVPEVGDEVLIGFEFDDPRRPYVLGGLLNDNTSFDLGGSAISGGKVTKRGIVSPAGNKLIFADDLPPGPPGTAPPNTSQITLGSKDDAMGLVIDQAGGTITVTCKPKPPASKTPTGAVTIEVGEAGTITIKSGTGGNIKIEAGGQLELSGQLGVKISSQAMVEVSGKMIKLN
jgi:phage protein D